MTMTRQQRRARERVEQVIASKIAAFRKTNMLAEETYKAGYAEGWNVACNYAMKTCYAAAVMAFQDFEGWQIEGYRTERNTRFMRALDDYVTNTLSSEEIIDEALQKAGVAINFREPFPEGRVQEVAKGAAPCE